ncbi:MULTISPECIES: hypothetical protein [Cyanophyceae]|uniref:hypothetical protein n=1 Tax=Cyanophyceae TaxID=3028117 RepID=UPI0004ABC5CF|nr:MULTISPECIES: hypothetical protein [Cyanophyceae]AMA10203.1 hypothetical protein AWQ23_13220 [Picosynechococcus sp. PCC 73109]ANV88374.1 hypothetical protein AWQ22_13385 [Picosynechococcus sp. PCC 7117]ANV91561.1 hypothetical protein AWQ24_13480 [Picosynechococcus sp. PCC 8807]QCS48477.1 hypothetical protein FEK30_02935 [Picosynechococcus sp. PCC 11901]SMH50897.1 hypothetical protein SAMN06272755_2275 [Picosynechococcus sp. OG1]
MPIEIIVIVAALIISWLVFTAFIKIVKTSVQTAVTIAAIVLVLQLVFGIQSGQVITQIIELPRIIWDFFNNR